MKIQRITKSLIVICFCSLIMCISCGKNEAVVIENKFYLYTVNQDGDEIESEEFDLVVSEGGISDNISEILTAFGEQEELHKEYHTRESTCKVIDFQVKEEQLTLNFDAGYLLMSAVDEVLHRAAIVKTFTQLKEIKEVQFTVEGQPLTINKKAVGFMKGEDFIHNNGKNSAMKTTTISFYYADTKGTSLIEVPVNVTYDSTIPIVQLMMSELIKGPEENRDLEKMGLRRTLPKDVTCNSIAIRDKICYIDFSADFENVISELSGDVIVYSVVNLLSALPNVDKVQFTVEGEYVELPGFPKMNAPFERNLNIVANTITY